MMYFKLALKLQQELGYQQILNHLAMKLVVVKENT
jgi:hypothetical protein